MTGSQISRRPYLIRAIVDWVQDSGYTPLLLVAATEPGVHVPEQFIDEEGRIVLNVSEGAVQSLELGNEQIRFRARFGGTPHIISLPPGAVLAVYARETGDGMMLGDAESYQGDPTDDPEFPPDGSGGGDSARKARDKADEKAKKRAHLKVVK